MEAEHEQSCQEQLLERCGRAVYKKTSTLSKL
jgi:hypothetical protein